ncbi:MULTISPECIES: hypothetical protein [unclassified Bradyrhizobium]|uniref:hypothetical protein n=1 Tax=unclassified Bradyrhizobium TaxID=2631580 RepID=UPI002479B669|nr:MULTISPECIES: hypothetical protein [unclassified Bradyrhizobium]WGS18783.1 hypothetical protein MTX22_30250 [Bradyrhizobium sp. ISRA463]WGS25608.1 hypothetical protein MTX19_27825 [Bradyrhizobium sp. ISRA464]
MGTDEVVECIRPLLKRFSENEETVRRLVATDDTFDALCHQYRYVIELLKGYEAEADRETEVERLEQRRAGLEEELLTRIEGYQPH